MASRKDKNKSTKPKSSFWKGTDAYTERLPTYTQEQQELISQIIKNLMPEISRPREEPKPFLEDMTGYDIMGGLNRNPALLASLGGALAGGVGSYMNRAPVQQSDFGPYQPSKGIDKNMILSTLLGALAGPAAYKAAPYAQEGLQGIGSIAQSYIPKIRDLLSGNSGY